MPAAAKQGVFGEGWPYNVGVECLEEVPSKDAAEEEELTEVWIYNCIFI